MGNGQDDNGEASKKESSTRNGVRRYRYHGPSNHRNTIQFEKPREGIKPDAVCAARSHGYADSLSACIGGAADQEIDFRTVLLFFFTSFSILKTGQYLSKTYISRRLDTCRST